MYTAKQLLLMTIMQRKKGRGNAKTRLYEYARGYIRKKPACIAGFFLSLLIADYSLVLMDSYSS